MTTAGATRLRTPVPSLRQSKRPRPEDLMAQSALEWLRRKRETERASGYLTDFAGFARNVLGMDLAPYQEEILAALTARRRVCVRSPHGAGKSAIAAAAVLAFATTRESARRPWKAVTTAGVWRQLERYLWPEIRRWTRTMDWKQAGIPQWRDGTEALTLAIQLRHGEAFAVASDRAELIEGAHADEILYVLDEAKSIPDGTWDAVEGAFSVGQAYALALSTPGPPIGRFFSIQARRPGLEDWAVRHVTLAEAIDAGRISRDWAQARRRQWGEASPVYRNRVLGEFAEAEDGIIPLAWIEAAVERWLEWRDSGKPAGRQTTVGVDVGGGMGGDATVLARRSGDLVTALEVYPRGDEMTTAGRVVAALQSGGTAIVDGIGIGAGVVSRLREQRHPCIAFIAGASSSSTDRSGELGYENERAAAWWGMRERLDPSPRLDGLTGKMVPGSAVALPDDDELIGELSAPRWKPTSRGKVLVESKDEIRKRIGRSTDRADAVVMAFWKSIGAGHEKVGACGPASCYGSPGGGGYEELP